jgi:hypothetical protein
VFHHSNGVLPPHAHAAEKPQIHDLGAPGFDAAASASMISPWKIRVVEAEHDELYRSDGHRYFPSGVTLGASYAALHFTAFM